MEVVVKVEKLVDDIFENITMAEAQFSETDLPLENNFKNSISKTEEDDTSILSDNIKSNLSLSEAIQTTPTVKPVSTNYAESSTTFQSNKRIYSPPFYKLVSIAVSMCSKQVNRFHFYFYLISSILRCRNLVQTKTFSLYVVATVAD